MSTFMFFVLVWLVIMAIFVAAWIWIRRPSARDHILVTVAPDQIAKGKLEDATSVFQQSA